MSSWMTPQQQYQWRISLELKLRKLHGDAFQDFFSTVMQRTHKSDFVRVRPFGQLGDKGCDGYVQSVGRLYQCFGKIDGAAVNAKDLTNKIRTDAAKAIASFASIMKEWHFVHNILDGTPVTVVTTIEQLRGENPSYVFGIAELEWFIDTVFQLLEADIMELLGPTATAQDTYGLKIEEVRAVIDALEVDIGAAPIDEGDPKPVPVEKLEFNKLAAHWRAYIRGGSGNAPHVASYFARHPKPGTGKAVAKAFKQRYSSLKLQGLLPDRIMFELFIQTGGNGPLLPPQYVAVQALLAYLFDACDLFEDQSQVLTPA